MSVTIYEAAAGALLQQMRLDVLSNNLANVNTTGFKADRPVFRLDPQLMEPAPTAQLGYVVSPYAPPLECYTDFSAGPLRQTGNPLDVAVDGNGFFEVSTPEGPRYTRKGSFSINDQGQLSSDGRPVMGQGGEIKIEGGSLVINASGEVLIDGQLVDTLKLVDFPKPYQLEKQGESLFAAGDGQTPRPAAAGTHVMQGFIESSNVEAIRTMTEIIETMRVFDTYQRIIRSADETTAQTVSDVGSVVV